jgi:hypothetical protein
VGSDPAGGGYDLGIFIGANGNVTAPNLRQLFLLAVKKFGAGERGRLVGFRQYLTMGVYLQSSNKPAGVTYLLERPIETPTWKFVDGNVLWGVRQVPPKTHFKANVGNAEGLAFEYGQTPAQLFETIVGPQITPPYGGAFPGNVLNPELGRFFELRCRRWSRPSRCDIPFEGPCDIAFFASVQQTNPATRTAPPLVMTSQFLTTQGAVPEDAFLQNYPGSTYIRIAGSLIFEMEEQAPTGSPKTYRRPGDGDRLTRDTTETGDNTMRRSAEETSEYKACEDDGGPGQPGGPGGGRQGGGHPAPKRPVSPPHPNASAFGSLPRVSTNISGGVVNRLIRKWRLGRKGGAK